MSRPGSWRFNSAATVMPEAPPPTITMACFTSAMPAAALCTIASIEASFAICPIFFTCTFSYLTISKYIILSTGVKEVPMKPIAVTAKLAVAPQPKLSDFQEFRRSGFTTVVNNRPDGEDPTQLGYAHIPVTAMGMTEQDARLLKETIEQAPGPVVAHCKSGARSFYLWVLSGDLDPLSDEDLLAKARELGVDTNAARTWLAAHRSPRGNHK